MPSDESKGSQLDAIGSLAQRQLDNTELYHIRGGEEQTISGTIHPQRPKPAPDMQSTRR